MNKAMAILFFFIVTTTSAGASAQSSPDAAPCMQGSLAQFGRYIGDWRIDDQTLAKDGNGWSPGNGERWVFECIGDGVAVQDYWLPASGGFGTNLRTYNPDVGQWEIVWAAAGLNGLMRISAEIDDAGNIVMSILSPTPKPPRRIIFYPPDDGGWNWVQQMSFDDGDTWTDVYRIRATPWNR